MNPKMKAVQCITDAYYNIESNDPISMALDQIDTIILELKSVKVGSDLKDRIQYWQQVKDHVPIKKK